MKTAVCLVTKAYLKEDVEFWIDHYLNYCGFDTVFLYDNESYCGPLEKLLKPNPNVIISSFTDEYKLTKLHIQQDIYEELYMKIRNDYDWLMCVDDDEFLWLNKEKYKDIKEFLTDMYSQNKKQICLPWQIISYEDYHIPALRTKPAPMDCFYTYYNFFHHKPYMTGFKSIFNCKDLLIRSCNNHCWANADHNFYLEYSDTPIKDMYLTSTEVEVYKCNAKLIHYRRRSYDEWYKRINRRGVAWPQEVYKNRLAEFESSDKMPVGFTVYYDPFNLDN